MVETFTPAVCGSRKRRRIAVVLFALAAVAASAALGGVLGAAGAAAGARHAVLAAAALALLAAGREAGLIRLPLPQARRQVPERWRFELPLPVWSVGYGAGLGAGVFTYQPVSTLWVACAGALALARPLPAALCLGLYGAGRALTLVWPRRRGDQPTEAVERLARRRGAVGRANAVALAGCAALLALAPVAQGRVVAAGLDPTVDRGVLAWARQTGSVVVRSGGNDVEIAGGRAPALDGQLLAYVGEDGIRIVRWRTKEEVRHVRTNATAVALAWPLIVFRREDPTRRRLVLRNLQTGARSVIATVKSKTDLGRPSMKHGRLVWHVANTRGSRINLMMLTTRKRRTIAATKIGLLRSPSVYRQRLIWIDERSGTTALRMRFTWGGPVRTIARLRSRDLGFWTTALATRTAYATRWSLRTRSAKVYSFRH
jgi:hypothetical protein